MKNYRKRLLQVAAKARISESYRKRSIIYKGLNDTEAILKKIVNDF